MESRGPVNLTTRQGRRGEGQLFVRDESINGCTALAALTISAFLVGLCSIPFIGKIIDGICDPIIERIRREEGRGEGSLMSQATTRTEMCRISLFEVRPCLISFRTAAL